MHGSVNVAQLLLSESADADRKTLVNAEDYWLRTPLHYAMEAKHIAVVKLLQQAGAQPHSRDVDGKLPHQLESNGPPASAYTNTNANAQSYSHEGGSNDSHQYDADHGTFSIDRRTGNLTEENTQRGDQIARLRVVQAKKTSVQPPSFSLEQGILDRAQKDFPV